MEFRPFVLKQTEEFTKLVMALYSQDPQGERMSRTKVIRTIEHLTCRPDKGEIIMFVDSGRFCGYAIMLFLWSNEHGGDIILVDELYVCPQYRSKGLGSSFFHWLEARYTEAKAVAVETTPDNNRARDLYKNLGFETDENIRMLKKLRNKH